MEKLKVKVAAGARVVRLLAVPAAFVIVGVGCGDNITDSASTTSELPNTTTELGSATAEDATNTTGEGSTTSEPSSCTTLEKSTSMAPIKSKGTAIIHGTSGFDFDEGKEGAIEADVEVFWEMETDTGRRLRPFSAAEETLEHYALLANLGPRSLESVTVEELLEAPYSSEPIKGGDAVDEMPVGTVIAVHTTEADVAKVRIEGRDVPGTQPGSDQNLEVCWVTFDVAPPQVDGVAAGPGGGSGEVELTWSPVPVSADVVSYRLYKRQSDGMELPPVSVNPDTLEELPDGRLAVTDAFDIGPWLTADPPGPRCYRVSAVSTAGVEGPASAEACGAPVGG